ncbi:putative ATP-dependent RNA helicase ddx27 [Cichlidogyrus casuarinus]|uniref:RNA helicase n=1 Tax=Cichlidogyrus casuarinus TaxID=1844966 RepID=A0ABD2QGP3_9PLAT
MAIFNSNFVFETDDIRPSLQTSIKIVDKLDPSPEEDNNCATDALIEKYKKDMLFEDEADIIDETGDFLRINNKKTPKKQKSIVQNDVPEDDTEEKYQFSGTVTSYEDVSSFLELRLSRPILKALADMEMEKPTPIQCCTIPIALLGRDICALRFVVEFGCLFQVQLVAGGLDLKTQEASLRKCPDVVVATPGRLIDHIANAPGFSLANIQYLVLDEADKLLDDQFAAQLEEIVRNCSRQRQTLLFSATMTESVKELASLSLQSPVRVFLSQSTALATEIHHEFVRIRPQREQDREALVGALIMRNFPKRTIVFMQTKRQCHRMHILLGLLSIQCGELHGDMSQDQRLATLKRFSDTALDQAETPVDVLLATDLAARGIDIPNVATVINFSLPPTMKQYVHRVGRTARAAASGRAVSLAGETDRRLLKEIVRETKYPVKSRTVPPEIVQKVADRIKKFEPIVAKILQNESAERDLRIANKQLQIMEQGVKDPGLDRKNWFDEQREKKKQELKAKRKAQQSKKTQPHVKNKKRRSK